MQYLGGWTLKDSSMNAVFQHHGQHLSHAQLTQARCYSIQNLKETGTLFEGIVKI